jgi:hypothetical protein
MRNPQTGAHNELRFEREVKQVDHRRGTTISRNRRLRTNKINGLAHASTRQLQKIGLTRVSTADNWRACLMARAVRGEMNAFGVPSTLRLPHAERREWPRLSLPGGFIKEPLNIEQ